MAVFGGTFEKAWRANVIQAFEREHNVRVRVVTGLSAENFAKLRAQKDNPQMDVVTFDAPFALVAAREGLLETLDAQRIPNLSALHDFALPKDRAYVAFFTSSQVLAYNTQHVKTAPTSWEDLWKPEYKGKVVLPEIGSISGAYFVAMMGKAFGKGLFDADAAFARVKTLRPSVLTFWTSHDQLAQLLVQGEVWLSPWASDRAAFQVKSGAPIASVTPKEGAIFGMGAMGIAKGSQAAGARREVRQLLARGRPAEAQRRDDVHRADEPRRAARRRRGEARALRREPQAPGRPRLGRVRQAPRPVGRALEPRDQVGSVEGHDTPGAMQPHLVLRGIRKTFGRTVAVDGLDLDVAPGEFVALLGPSGCGKTTTLRIVAGFERPDRGEVLIQGVPATDKPPYRRDVGIVFQSYALFPHMTVGGERRLRAPDAEGARRRARHAGGGRPSTWSGSPASDARYPRQLSGGQQQRVAVARAIVIRPSALLFDEPLSNLDARLRQTMREELRELQRTLRIATILVTHDQEEALSLADRDRGHARGPGRAGRAPRRRSTRARRRRSSPSSSATATSSPGGVQAPDGAPPMFRADDGLMLPLAPGVAGRTGSAAPSPSARRPSRCSGRARRRRPGPPWWTRSCSG